MSAIHSGSQARCNRLQVSFGLNRTSRLDGALGRKTISLFSCLCEVISSKEVDAVRGTRGQE